MPKRTNVGSSPSGRLPRAFRISKRRKRNPSATSGDTGKAGGIAYHTIYKSAPKPRTDEAKYTIINVKAPGGATRQVAIGKKRGGVYPQGKWDNVKSIVAALPAAAVAVGAVGYLGSELKNNATVKQWSMKFPGGTTGMALAFGATAGYVAYKNRHVLGLLVGLAVAAWALIKLASGKFKGLTEGEGYSEDYDSTTSPDTAPLSLPSGSPDNGRGDLVQEAIPGLGIEAKRHFLAGEASMSNGAYENAIIHFNNAWKASGDYTMSLYTANAYFEKGLKKGAFVKDASGNLKLNSDLTTAKALYQQYIDKGGITAEVNQEARDGAIEYAESRIAHIDSMKSTGTTSDPIVSGHDEVVEEIYEETGADLVGDDEEVIEEIIEGDDEYYTGADDDEEVVEEIIEGDEGEDVEVVEEEVAYA